MRWRFQFSMVHTLHSVSYRVTRLNRSKAITSGFLKALQLFSQEPWPALPGGLRKVAKLLDLKTDGCTK
jgi:hypothetical protein